MKTHHTAWPARIQNRTRNLATLVAPYNPAFLAAFAAIPGTTPPSPEHPQTWSFPRAASPDLFQLARHHYGHVHTFLPDQV